MEKRERELELQGIVKKKDRGLEMEREGECTIVCVSMCVKKREADTSLTVSQV